jgi:purine-binding chemotaxis protein CheW
VLVLQDQPNAGSCLVFKVDSLVCALPIASVVETMRPLPVQRLEQAPEMVLGLAMVRGIPTPVIDAGRLMGAGPLAQLGRFVSVAVGARRIALAVTSVWGIRAVSAQSLRAMPAVLTRADTQAVAAIGALDQELLMLLQGVRLVPESVFAASDLAAAAAPSPSSSASSSPAIEAQ